MKFTATVFADHEPNMGFAVINGNPNEAEIEFDDVKEVKYDQQFFIVIKNNGEQFATRSHTIKKYSLTNQ